MSLTDSRILLTGAAGGIGSELAAELSRRGARLVLLGRAADPLAELAASLDGPAVPLAADLCDLTSLDEVAQRAEEAHGGLDAVIHNAGLLSFRPVEDERPEALEALMRVNLLAPMLLTRALLPGMRARGSGQILNVGSIFGSIAFAYFATYSASKFALRGWSQALRRELAGTGIQVKYVAPRATRTPLANAFGRMAQAVGMKLDEPAWVAARIADALERPVKERYLGFPECFFVRLNGLLPGFVDRALAKQDRATRPFAEAAAEAARALPSETTRPASEPHPPSAPPASPASRPAASSASRPTVTELHS